MKKAILPRNKKLKVLSAHLRNNATQEENKLWYEFLREYPIRFNRQRIVGNYIADFYCARAKLVIELDGSQHYEKAAMAADAERTQYLSELGLDVLRFANSDINESFYEVCSVIDETVKSRL